MKMKNKSIQKINLNESSSTYVEPSFSKITFRKRGLDNSSELINIDEEENVSSLDFNPTEEINQLSWPSSDPEHPKSKKKRKKNKDHHEFNASKEKNIDVREDKSLEELKSITNSTSPECLKRKKKRKSHVSENPSLPQSPSKEYLNSINEDEEQVSKKKRKKKKKLDINEGFGEDVRSDKELSMAKVEPPELNCSIKSPSSPDVCKKKKKNALGIPLLNHTKEFGTNRNLDEEHIVKFEGGSESNEANFSRSTTDDLNVVIKKKKKKKKHIAEESSFQSNVGPGFKDSETLEVKGEIEAKESNDSLCGYNSYLGNENTPMKNQKILDFEDVVGVNLKNNNENSSDQIKTTPDSIFKGSKRKDSLSGHCLVEVNKETDSPLFKKKKKTQKLMGESNLNIYSNEQVQKVKSNFENTFLANRDSIKLISSDKKNKVPKFISKANPDMSDSENCGSSKMDSKDNEAEGCHITNVSQTVQSPKAAKKKHKLKSGVPNSDQEPPITNNDGDVIKSPETQNITVERTKTKHNKMTDENLSGERLGKHTTLLASDFTGKKQKKKEPQMNSIEEKLRTTSDKEVDSNSSVTTARPKKKQQANISEVKNDKCSMLSPVKKNNTNSNIESLRSQLLKEALNGAEVSNDLLPKLTKHELGTENRSITPKKSKIKKASATEIAENLPSKPLNLNTGLEENPDTLRKFLLEDATCSIKGIEHLPPKSSKPKTKKKVVENVDTLRKRLLKEAITSTKKAGDLPQKSSKSKTGVKEDFETLKKRLLEEAVRNMKGPEELPSKSSKLKSKIKTNVKTKRKKILTEVITSTKKAEDLLLKSRKLKTVVKEDFETLENRLLEEAVGNTKRPEDLPPKSSKLKIGVVDNSDTLRTQLLKVANETSKVPDDLSLKSRNLKGAVKSLKADISSNLQKDKKGFDNALKSKSEKKHKKKHKHKNDIDLLTNMLLSKALKKVSSSSGPNETQL